MTIPKWNPPVPDAQMIAEARTEDRMRSIVQWRDVPGTDSTVGLDRDGEVVVIACGRPSTTAQPEDAETWSQVVGEDDEYA